MAIVVTVGPMTTTRQQLLDKIVCALDNEHLDEENMRSPFIGVTGPNQDGTLTVELETAENEVTATYQLTLIEL